jgi:hypothetical protein
MPNNVGAVLEPNSNFIFAVRDQNSLASSFDGIDTEGRKLGLSK